MEEDSIINMLNKITDVLSKSKEKSDKIKKEIGKNKIVKKNIQYKTVKKIAKELESVVKKYKEQTTKQLSIVEIYEKMCTNCIMIVAGLKLTYEKNKMEDIAAIENIIDVCLESAQLNIKQISENEPLVVVDDNAADVKISKNLIENDQSEKRTSGSFDKRKSKKSKKFTSNLKRKLSSNNFKK